MSDGATDRAAIAAEVWADAEKSPNSHSQADQAGAQSTEEAKAADAQVAAAQAAADTSAAAKADEQTDPWAGVSPALRQQFEVLQSKVGNVDQLGERLKQAERRVGAMTTELHAAKEAAKTVSNAPTKEQIADAAASEAEWSNLQESFPEWTAATEKKIANSHSEILKRVPDADVIRRQVAEEVEQRVEAVSAEMAGHVVALKHPDWKAVRDTPEFRKWNEENGLRDSDNPIEVIAILDGFAAHKASLKTPKQIEAERQARLEASTTTQGRSLRPPKSEADMAEAEMRAHLVKQVWRGN